ncbi:unnamed protein product [Prorocentrum cordatum]|uniref:Uncharacterized protein n=1 Tax=Prorocentrum cordatum TaxID=2364126 RepID=A0ABN9SST8_9DINO|nr:unnamed protein product [Polarella glacialis]
MTPPETSKLPDLPAGRSRCWGTAGPPTAAAPIPRRRPRPRSPARQGEGPREAQGQRPSGSVFAERDGQRRHRCAERAAPPEADPGAESRWGGAAVTGGRRTHYYTARLNPTRAVRPEPIVESYVQLGGTSSDGRPGRCGQAAAAGRVRGGRASSGASRDNSCPPWLKNAQNERVVGKGVDLTPHFSETLLQTVAVASAALATAQASSLAACAPASGRPGQRYSKKTRP